MARTPNGLVRIEEYSYGRFTLIDCKIFPSKSKISISSLAVTIEYQFRVCVNAMGTVPFGIVIFFGKVKDVELSCNRVKIRVTKVIIPKIIVKVRIITKRRKNFRCGTLGCN